MSFFERFIRKNRQSLAKAASLVVESRFKGNAALLAGSRRLHG
jgi:hypothetical protein